MRLTTLLTASLLSLAACADHGGSIVGGTNPPSPVNPPDQHLIDPVTGSGGGNTGNSTNGGNNGGGTGGGSQTGGSGNNGGNPPGSGGNPVPEPTALFLVGSGLAGLVLLRRRKQQANAS